LEYKLFPQEKAKQRNIYFRNPGFGGQNIILDRSLFLRLGGFDENMPASVDRDLAARIIQNETPIHVQPSSIAILCDHQGQRVRESQVLGNWVFIKKHYKHMTKMELWRALISCFRRFLIVKLSSSKSLS